MNYTTHVIGGISASLITNHLIIEKSLFNLPENNKLMFVPILIAGAVIGSLLPDIDHTQSFIGRRLKPISKSVKVIFGHRGITHSLIFWIAIISLLLFFGNNLALGESNDLYNCLSIGIIVGAFSHLLLDSFTKPGIPVFYPISKHRLSLMKFKTGGIGEKLVSVFLCIVTLYTLIA